jgi:Tfp pilus assembly protein PilF
MSDLGSTYAIAEKDNEAKRIIEELKEISNKHYVSSYMIATVYASLGENDKAFEWLEKACEERYEGMVYIKTHPNLNPIRTDPRFVELLKKIGYE